MSGDELSGPIPLVFDDEELVHALAILIVKTHHELAEHSKMFNPSTNDKDEVVVGRLESVIDAAYGTHFGVPPTERFIDAFEQAACFCEHLAKDHIFFDGNKRTALVMLYAMIRLGGYDVHHYVHHSDTLNPEDNEAYQWIQQLVSGDMTSTELAALAREYAVRRRV